MSSLFPLRPTLNLRLIHQRKVDILRCPTAAQRGVSLVSLVPPLFRGVVPRDAHHISKVVGHVHFVIQRMQAPTSTAVLDPGVFEFFKGLDFGDGTFSFPRRVIPTLNVAVNGESSVDVVGGLDAGAFRVCTIVCKYLISSDSDVPLSC